MLEFSNIYIFWACVVVVWFVQLGLLCVIFQPEPKMLVYPILMNSLFGTLLAVMVVAAPFIVAGVALFFLACYWFCRLILKVANNANPRP